MELFDPHIREELLSRIELDPSSLAVNQNSGGCLATVAVLLAFAIGVACGVWWFP